MGGIPVNETFKVWRRDLAVVSGNLLRAITKGCKVKRCHT